MEGIGLLFTLLLYKSKLISSLMVSSVIEELCVSSPACVCDVDVRDLSI